MEEDERLKEVVSQYREGDVIPWAYGEHCLISPLCTLFTYSRTGPGEFCEVYVLCIDIYCTPGGAGYCEMHIRLQLLIMRFLRILSVTIFLKIGRQQPFVSPSAVGEHGLL